MSDSIAAVVTTLSIIEVMAEFGDPIGVSELAKRTSTAKPRTYRHLRTLLDKQYVAQEADTDKYYLTLKFFRLGQAVAANTSFTKEARRLMPVLRGKTNSTVAIGQPEEAGVRILDILKQSSNIEISTPPGTLLDFQSSAQGKIVLAFSSKDFLNGFLERALQQSNAGTRINIPALESELELIKRRHWAVAPGETLIGVNALAAPVFDSQGTLTGTISIVGSIQHLPADPSSDMIKAVTDAAACISMRLGYLENLAT